MSSGNPSTPLVPDDDWVADEITEVQARRDRIAEARAANPHLRSDKVDDQLAILDRQLNELREVAA